MRIRFLAAAVVTAGALMATLTGAASASDDPAPSTPEAAFSIVCEAGDHQRTVAVRRLTDAELKDLQAKGGHWRKAVEAGSVEATRDTGAGPVKITETTKATEATESTESTESTEATKATESTEAAKVTEATDSVAATLAVPATSLDPSKQAEAAGTTTVRVSPLEEGGSRLDALSHGVLLTKVTAEAAPGTPLPEGTVVACARKAEKAEAAEKAEEPGEAAE
jgi:hypothetical protein